MCGGSTRTQTSRTAAPRGHPFHELPNIIMTPHCSGWTAGMVRRRWDEVADNIARFMRGDSLINIVTRT